MAPPIEYIFSINTGRSGSDYLAKLFARVPGCRAFHEPEPIGNGLAMRLFAQSNTEAMRRIAADKAAHIRQLRRPGEIYVETNHCFIKGFGWHIPDYLAPEKIGVVILTRTPSRIADSYARIGSTPLTRLGKDWITTPDKHNPLLRPPAMAISPKASYRIALLSTAAFRCQCYIARKLRLSKPQRPRWLADYEWECLRWYAEETAAQSQAFRQQFPAIRYYEVDIEDLNASEQVETMLAYFGFSNMPALAEIVGRTTNTKKHKSAASARDLCQKPINR